MILLQSQILERSLEVSPYNAAAFGVLVAVLIAAVAALWIRNANRDKANDELVKDMITLMTKTEMRLTEDMELKKNVQELLTLLKSRINAID